MKLTDMFWPPIGVVTNYDGKYVLNKKVVDAISLKRPVEHFKGGWSKDIC